MADRFLDINPNELEAKAERIERKLARIKETLGEFDERFSDVVETAVDAFDLERERLKAKAAKIKREYEQRRAKHEALIEQYAVIRWLFVAERRFCSRSESSLSEMDESDRERFCADIWADVSRRYPRLEEMDRGPELVIELLDDDLGEADIDGSRTADPPRRGRSGTTCRPATV